MALIQARLFFSNYRERVVDGKLVRKLSYMGHGFGFHMPSDMDESDSCDCEE